MSSSSQEDTQMRTVVVLAMHGSPPRDFPKAQVAMVVGLHMWLERASGPVHAMIERYHTRLDTRIRTWPRTAENDPFHAASQKLAAQLGRETGCEVVVGFNEFCAPSLEESFDQAASYGADRIVVVTPMMTPGGEHAEVDIPKSIQHAQERHPEIEFVYAWPFGTDEVTRFLAAQIDRFL
jgi:sirohydrochlorin cobaltochelatase